MVGEFNMGMFGDIFGGIAGDLLGSSGSSQKTTGSASTTGSSESTTTANQTTNATQTLQQLLSSLTTSSTDSTEFQNQLANLIASSVNNTSGTTTTSKGTEDSNAALADIIAKLTGAVDTTNQQYSKEAAIADSQDAVTAMMQQILSSGINNVLNTDTNTGGYNSTTQKLLADNLQAQAINAGAAKQLETIQSYAALGQQENTNNLSALLSAIGMAQDAVSGTSSSSTSSEQSNQQSSANTTGGSSSNTLSNTLENTTANTTSKENSSAITDVSASYKEDTTSKNKTKDSGSGLLGSIF